MVDRSATILCCSRPKALVQSFQTKHGGSKIIFVVCFECLFWACSLLILQPTYCLHSYTVSLQQKKQWLFITDATNNNNNNWRRSTCLGYFFLICYVQYVCESLDVTNRNKREMVAAPSSPPACRMAPASDSVCKSLLGLRRQHMNNDQRHSVVIFKGIVQQFGTVAHCYHLNGFMSK